MATARRKQNPQDPEPKKAVKEKEGSISREALLRGLGVGHTEDPNIGLFGGRVSKQKGIQEAFEKTQDEAQASVEAQAELGFSDRDMIVNPAAAQLVKNRAQDIIVEKSRREKAEFRASQIEKAIGIRKKQQDIEEDEFELGLKRQQAEQAGIVIPEEETEEAVRKTEADAIAEELERDGPTEISQAFLQLARQNGLVGRSPVANVGTLKDLGNIRNTLLESVSRLNDKDLRFSPFGGVGRLAGAGLNLVGNVADLLIPGDQSGIGNIGTEIFGGRATAAGQVKLLADTFFRLTPAGRSELEDIFARERLDKDITSAMSKKLHGIEEDENLPIAQERAIELETVLANSADTKAFFGSDGMLIEFFRIAKNLKSAPTDLEIDLVDDPRQREILRKHKAAQEANMNQAITDFVMQGGTPETFSTAFKEAQTQINNLVKDEFTARRFDPNRSATGAKVDATRTLASDAFLGNLEEFRSQFLPEVERKQKLFKRLQKELEGARNREERIGRILLEM